MRKKKNTARGLFLVFAERKGFAGLIIRVLANLIINKLHLFDFANFFKKSSLLLFEKWGVMCYIDVKLVILSANYEICK